VDQRAAAAKSAETHQVRIAEAVGDLGGAGGEGVAGRGIALGKALSRDGVEQVALLHAVALAVVEQPPGSGKPASGAGALARVEEAEGQHVRATNGSRHLTRTQARLMRPRPDVGAFVVPADQVGRYRKALQVLKPDWEGAVRLGQPNVRLPPGAPPKRL